MNKKKPDEMASYLYTNSIYYCGSKGMAVWSALFFVQNYIDYSTKMDDKIYWTLVKDELYKLERSR